MPTLTEFAEAGADSALAPGPIASPEVSAGTFDAALVDMMHATMKVDRNVFNVCHDYFHGKHIAPYAPTDASAQIKDIQERSITNWIPLLVNLPSQVSFVDGYRRGTFGQTVDLDSEAAISMGANNDPKRYSPEYGCWQRNRMDARQATIYRAALTYGHAFAHVNNVNGPDRVKIEVLSTRNTVAFFDDPVNDIRPKVVLTIKSRPRSEKVHGLAVLWDETHRYELSLTEKGEFIQRGEPFAHGMTGCPVIRYTCYVDDEGATLGVVLPIIPLQNRVNQAVFSTNITADFGAFKVRTAAGLQPTFKRAPDGSPLLDPVTGLPIAEPIVVSQARMLVSPAPDTKFGTLDETPLNGYITNEDQAVKALAAVAQFPLHALLGNVSNLSAEALAALEAQFMRFLGSLHTSWGESHEELFRLVAEAMGDTAGAAAYGGEVRWRDMSSKAFASVMDGLSKAEALGIPKRGLWPFFPGATSGDLQDWDQLLGDEKLAALDEPTPTASAAREARPSLTTPKPATASSPPAPVTERKGTDVSFSG